MVLVFRRKKRRKGKEMLNELKYYTIKIVATILLFLAVLLMEAYCFGKIPLTAFEVEEDIATYKEQCKALYPIASLDIEPRTNRLTITWKDGTVSRRQ